MHGLENNIKLGLKTARDNVVRIKLAQCGLEEAGNVCVGISTKAVITRNFIWPASNILGVRYLIG